MKVSKAQSDANRAHIVETAARLFRERGFDGVGVADLMAAAGFTHGGFYKRFGSKADLMAEAAASGIASTVALADGRDLAGFVDGYLSRGHRADLAQGCTLAALGGDAARAPGPVREAFAAGIERVLETVGAAEDPARRTAALATLAQVVGALVMSRACPDDAPLADELLAAGRQALARPRDAA